MMYKVIFFLFLTLIFAEHDVNAQKKVGFLIGPNFSKFMDFTNDANYKATYKLKSGITSLIYYKTQVDSHAIRLEVEYNQSNSNLQVYDINGTATFYKNLQYRSNSLALNLLGDETILSNKSLSANVFFGPSLGYQFLNHLQGDGWNNVFYTVLDSNNNPIPVFGVKNYSINENNSENVTKLMVGFKFGYELNAKINSKIDLVFNNSALFRLSKLLKYEELKYTTAWSLNFGVGFRYNINSSQKN